MREPKELRAETGRKRRRKTEVVREGEETYVVGGRGERRSDRWFRLMFGYFCGFGNANIASE